MLCFAGRLFLTELLNETHTNISSSRNRNGLIWIRWEGQSLKLAVAPPSLFPRSMESTFFEVGNTVWLLLLQCTLAKHYNDDEEFDILIHIYTPFCSQSIPIFSVISAWHILDHDGLFSANQNADSYSNIWW